MTRTTTLLLALASGLALAAPQQDDDLFDPAELPDPESRTGPGEKSPLSEELIRPPEKLPGRVAAPPVPRTPQEFVTAAAQLNQGVLELARLGGEKGSSAELKKLARTLTQDHQRAGAELAKVVAGSNRLTLPPGALDRERQLDLAALRDLSGDAFDRAWTRLVLTEHRRGVEAFALQARSGEAPAVRAWAARTLPTLERHLESALALERSLRAVM